MPPSDMYFHVTVPSTISLPLDVGPPELAVVPALTHSYTRSEFLFTIPTAYAVDAAHAEAI